MTYVFYRFLTGSVYSGKNLHFTQEYPVWNPAFFGGCEDVVLLSDNQGLSGCSGLYLYVLPFIVNHRSSSIELLYMCRIDSCLILVL